MRRISLALALIGAVAATGCSSGAKPTASSAAKGVSTKPFTVSVRLSEAGGTVQSGTLSGTTFTPDGNINCAAVPTNQQDPVTGAWSVVYPNGCQYNYPTGTVSVVLHQTTTEFFNGWYGACSGTGDCTLSGSADMYVVANFSSTQGAHPNFSSAAIHGPAYWSFRAGTGTLQCTQCHGAQLQGAGLAPSCATCHPAPMGDQTFTSSSPHGDTTAAAWGTHPVSSPCYRCHTKQGFEEWTGYAANALYSQAPYLGDMATGAYLGGTFKSTFDADVATNAAAYAGPLTCDSCHNGATDPATAGITTILFPSGAKKTTDKVTALCGQCHMARESSISVDAKVFVTATGATTAGQATNVNPDALVSGVGFVNSHYLGAAATLFGEEAAGWGQYSTRNAPTTVGTATVATYSGKYKNYTGMNEHGGSNNCAFCHNPHTGQLPSDATIASRCGTCHYTPAGTPVQTFLDLEQSRQFGFDGDIDGLHTDSTTLDLKTELGNVATQLFAMMQGYATNIIGTGICYDPNAYPYYFAHTGTGDCVGTPNTAPRGTTSNATGDYLTGAYNSFTPSLMRAAYNYNWFKKEPGAWAHNPRYTLEVLYDAGVDLGAGLEVAGFTSPTLPAFTAKRGFNGHFGAADAASQYAAMVYHGAADSESNLIKSEDFTGFPAPACYQCHGGKGGFAAYLASAPNTLTGAVFTAANKIMAFQCSVCHALNGGNMTTLRSDITTMYFPPGKTIDATNSNGVVAVSTANVPAGYAICGTCHSGRENGTSVKLAGGTPGTFALGPINPHYLGAAGMMQGSKAGVMYQYAGKSYSGFPVFWNGSADNGPHGSPHAGKCISCHAPKGSKHTFEIDLATTVPVGTYHGVQNTNACNGCHTGPYALAPKATEFAAASDELFTAMQAYVTSNLATVQGATGDANLTNICFNGASYPYWFIQEGTTCTTTTFAKFDGPLLAASFNYLWSQKEPGAWAHNEFYVMQALYDSIVDLGGTPAFTVTAVKYPYPSTNCDPSSPLNRGCPATSTP